VLVTYGGGSIKRNDVYDQVMGALDGRTVFEFGGIEPNPKFETLMGAVQLARKERASFLLAVGGGSVVDGTKFIAAAIPFEAGREWDILARQAEVKRAISVGAVITLPATGSEMNAAAVISRKETNEKLVFSTPLVYPRFSILDPESTYSLPPRQTANGIVDTFVHTTEQYLTFPVNSPLQDRQAEAILATIVEEGPKALASPRDYVVRANLMWCATQALNSLIGCGVPQDWATHMIGHEITALHGLDHGQTLAVVLPGLLRHQKQRKMAKLLQLGARIWGITEGTDDDRAEAAIVKTEEFFWSLGVKTKLNEYGIDEAGVAGIGARIEGRGRKLGEHGDLGAKEIQEILALCR